MYQHRIMCKWSRHTQKEYLFRTLSKASEEPPYNSTSSSQQALITLHRLFTSKVDIELEPQLDSIDEFIHHIYYIYVIYKFWKIFLKREKFYF